MGLAARGKVGYLLPACRIKSARDKCLETILRHSSRRPPKNAEAPVLRRVTRSGNARPCSISTNTGKRKRESSLSVFKWQNPNVFQCPNGTYKVWKYFEKKRVAFACGIHSEEKAVRLATKVEKLAAVEKGPEFVRRELQNTAESLGIRLTVPRSRTSNYSLDCQAGTYTVQKSFQNKIVTKFAHGIRSKQKAKALGKKLQELAAVEIDPEKVRRRLRSTAKELDIKLTVPSGR